MMWWLGLSLVFFLIFSILLGPVLIYLSALSVMKLIELYGRYLDWVFEKLSVMY